MLWSALLSPCCRPCRSAQVQPSLRMLETEDHLLPHNFRQLYNHKERKPSHILRNTKQYLALQKAPFWQSICSACPQTHSILAMFSRWNKNKIRSADRLKMYITLSVLTALMLPFHCVAARCLSIHHLLLLLQTPNWNSSRVKLKALKRYRIWSKFIIKVQTNK